MTITASGAPVGPFLRDPNTFVQSFLHCLEGLATGRGLLLAVAVACGAGAYFVLRHLWWLRRHETWARGARQILISAPPEVDPNAAREWWANLIGLLRPAYKRVFAGQPHLAWEYAWVDDTVQIRLWVPGVVPPGLIERAVEAAWPAARTRTVSPPEHPVPLDAVAVGGRLGMGRPDWLPLRSDHRTDSLRALVGAASGLAPGQHAVVQILARPATGNRLAKAHRAAAALRGGHPVRPQARLFDLLTPIPAARSTSRSGYVEHPERAAEVRAILDKAQEPQWEIAIRYGISTSPAVREEDANARAVRRQSRHGLRGRAHAIAAAYALYTGHNYLRRHRVRHPITVLERRWLRRGDLVSVSELAALAHLPWDTAVPGLTRAGAKAVPPPPAILAPGPDSKLIGVSDTGASRPIALGVTDGRHHLHVLGATGSGKSTLIAHMILADAAAGRGAVVIDPKGDLIIDVLSRLPEHVADKVVLFDPDEHDRRPVLNVVQGPSRDLAADNLVGIFRRIYKDFWGPRTDDILRSACLTLWRSPEATLTDIPRLLGDPHYRAPFTARLRDPMLAEFWAWYDAMSPGARANATGPVLNKLRAFLLRDFIRSTIGTAASTIDLPAVLDGGLLLVRAPKGLLGADASAVFGSLILAKVWETVTHRARHGQAARADTSLYIDECHNFLTLPHGMADLLAEARGYHLSLTLAHQDLAQLPRELREAISANARNKIYFAVSPEDAHTLQRHVTPNLSAHDLSHLDAFQAGARLIVDSAETPAFTLRTQPLPPPVPGRAAHIRRVSRDTYGHQPERRKPATDDPRIPAPAKE